MSSTSRRRRFLNQPPKSKLNVAVTVEPAGSVGVDGTLSTNGVPGPTAPLQPGVNTFRCTREGATYQFDVVMAWQAAGTVVITCFVEQPDGTVLTRDAMVFKGKNGDA